MVLTGSLLTLIVALLAGTWWLRRGFLIVTVCGPSMAPAYRDGDRVLVRRVSGRRLRVGQVVLADLPVTVPAAGTQAARFEAPESGAPPATLVADGPGAASHSSRVVKRIAAVAGDARPAQVEAAGSMVPPGSLVLLGDNPEQSADSRLYGYVSTNTVVGVVLRAIH